MFNNFYPPFGGYYQPQPQPMMNPIAQMKEYLEFIKEWEEKGKKKDGDKKEPKKMGLAESMLFMCFVMPFVGVVISGFQFWIFSSIFQHFPK